MIKIILIGLLGLVLTNCAQKTYEVKQEAKVEDNRVLNQVPQWYIDAMIEDGIIMNRDADNYIYSVGQGTSPDLQLAVEKAVMIAKAGLADQLKGEMNKRTELYTTEVGKDKNKEVASKIESTIVNVIKNTMVQGYEQWEKAVFETPEGQYRVYIGLKMGVGDANRLADYIAENATVDVDIDQLAEDAVKELDWTKIEVEELE
jgi:hypothetical protein|tara:strand:+ start:107 stop:715 length:609 start_codon:yes stop_codon:yes gene_type:complete